MTSSSLPPLEAETAAAATPGRRARRRAARSALPPWQRWLRRLSWVLMGSAVLVVGYVGVVIGYQGYEQHRLSQLFDSQVPPASVHDVVLSAAEPPHYRPHLADGQPLAKLDLSSVHFDAIVTEGGDSGILSSGPGHDDRTFYPGEGGLILIGNHNGFSGSWGDLKVGDPISVTMPYGRFHYTITRRYLVSGDDTTVISQQFKGETLVISTCWPLWEGALARQRLVFESTPVAATP